ncbi:hypothetical protein PENTCL1PPCAC_21397, partial [Pristionchus entomophagus]
RFNSGGCAVAEGVNCRKCRLNEMERMLSERSSTPTRERTCTLPSAPTEEENNKHVDEANHPSPSSPRLARHKNNIKIIKKK